MFKLSNNQNNILILIILVLFISQVFFNTKEGNTGRHIFYTNDLSTSDLDNMYKRKNDSLDLIDGLETLQTKEINGLITYINNTSDTDKETQVKDKIKNIEEISKQKEGIYKDLSLSLKFLLDKYGHSRIDKIAQDANVTMIEDELNKLKEKTQGFKNDLSEKQKKNRNKYLLFKKI